jgi:hypothetical protein
VPTEKSICKFFVEMFVAEGNIEGLTDCENQLDAAIWHSPQPLLKLGNLPIANQAACRS